MTTTQCFYLFYAFEYSLTILSKDSSTFYHGNSTTLYCKTVSVYIYMYIRSIELQVIHDYFSRSKIDNAR